MTTARKNTDDRREYENVKNKSAALVLQRRQFERLGPGLWFSGDPSRWLKLTTRSKKKNLHCRFDAASILFWFLNRKRKVCLDGLTAAGVLLDARMRLRRPCVPHNDLNEPAVRLQVAVYFILFSGL